MSKSGGDIAALIEGYRLCAASEGKSPSSIAIVTNSMRYLGDFLTGNGLSTDVALIGTAELRAFILYLQGKRCFSSHPYSKVQERALSGHTVNTYMRSIKAFWSWLMAEEIIGSNPFTRLKVPKAPKKIIATFSAQQIASLLAAMTGAEEGFRDTVIVLTLLDTGLRINELVNLKIADALIDDGLVKVLGKGNKERLVPIGRNIRKLLWRYIRGYRPEPALPKLDNLFLTRDGRPLTKTRVQNIMKRYGLAAGLSGVRCSPHTLRHTFAINFLRNDGDVFSLQKILGHSSLEMTRRYCELANVDIVKAHATASPVDNLAMERRASLMPRGSKKYNLKKIGADRSK